MPLIAATATHLNLSPATWLVLAGVAAVWAAGYAVACAVWPFTNCRRCHGTGRLRSPSGKAFRLCKRCKHTGRRLRFGRWAYNHIASVRREAD